MARATGSPAGASSLPPPPSPGAKPAGGRGWRIATLILALLLLLTWLANIGSSLASHLFEVGRGAAGAESRLQEVTLEHHRSSHKIAVIPVEGIISSASADGSGYNLVRLIEDQLKLAAKDAEVRAVLLKVNSPGGEVLASDDIYNAIVQFQNETKKPVVASMGALAASGGYYVSAPCRWIVANELTITGSIGVIMHGYNYRGLMNKVGLRPMVYKSGRFKDMLSGERDLEKLTAQEKTDLDEEDAMLQRMIQETYSKFRTVVGDGRAAANDRNQANQDGATGRKLSERWTDFADGRVLSGKEAFNQGLVDEVGNWRAAVKRAQRLAGIDGAELITYQVPFNLANLLGLFGQSNARTLKVDLGFDVPRLTAGLYYLAPSFLR